MPDPRFFDRAGPFSLEALAGLSGARLHDRAYAGKLIRDVAPLESAGPEDVTFLDNRKYAEAFSRSRAGAAFSAFEGKIWGKMLHIEPKRLIVQTWRSVNWPTAQTLDSILVLSFWPEKDGGRVELVQANVPDEDFAGVSQG